MKILYIASSPVPSTAANSVHVMKMGQALAADGHNVTLLSPEYKRKEISAVSDVFGHYGVTKSFRHIRTAFINLPKIKIYTHYLNTLGWILREQPEFVFTRDVIAAYLAVSSGFPAIYERHDSLESQTGTKKKIFRKLIRHKNFKGLIVISDALKAEIQSKFDISADQITVAHDGADSFPKDISPALPASAKIRIGYTGHLYQGRGIDIIGRIAARLPACEFHIVGGLASDVEFWKAELAECTNIVFHGMVAPARVPAYIKSFDILLAPYQNKVSVAGGGGDTSRWMSPLKVFEYMASGKPMIVSNLPVLREVLRPGENALLCAPTDSEAWAAAIERLTNDRALAEKLSSEALREFEEKYTWYARAKYILADRGFV